VSHRRRTPCCEIEAFRYLQEHDDDVRAAIRAEIIGELRGQVEDLTRYEACSPLVHVETEKGSVVERAAVLALLGSQKGYRHA